MEMVSQHWTEVMIHGPRGDEWEAICGTRRFPVVGFLPRPATLPGKPNAQVFMLDLTKIEPYIFEKIVAHLCAKFGLSAEEAKREIEAAGIPIDADSCTVSTNQMFFL